jgi:protein SCO1
VVNELKDPISRRLVVGSLLFGLIASRWVGPWMVRDGEAHENRRARAEAFPNVVLTTHQGKTVRFYDDLIKGKTVLINFMYGRCRGRCPTTTANLARVQAALGDRVGRDVFMYSITLKPEEDKPEDLRRYAEAHDVKPGWLFLTGKPGDIELLRRKLGFVDSDPLIDADRSNHIGIIRYGNEPYKRWAACPALSSPAQIVRSIDQLLSSIRGHS